MSWIRIDILDPKAEKLLKDLEDRNLISISEPSNSDFLDIVDRLRAKTKKGPSLTTITKEVEAVRSKRYGK